MWSETIFLGVTLQSNLKWYSHFEQITSKINEYVSIGYQIRNNLDKRHLKLLYNSLIYPQLTYVNIIWGKSCKTHLKPLFISQKRVIRTIMYRPRTHHTNNDFIQLQILKLEDINNYFS